MTSRLANLRRGLNIKLSWEWNWYTSTDGGFGETIYPNSLDCFRCFNPININRTLLRYTSEYVRLELQKLEERYNVVGPRIMSKFQWLPSSFTTGFCTLWSWHRHFLVAVGIGRHIFSHRIISWLSPRRPCMVPLFPPGTTPLLLCAKQELRIPGEEVRRP